MNNYVYIIIICSAYVNRNFNIIKNVPCTKCTQCGEEFLSGDVVKKIELITAKLKEMLTEVAIVDYASVA